MIQTGVAEKAGAILSGIRVGNPLMKAEGLLKERACEVTIPYHVQIFPAIMNHKAVADGEKRKGECHSVGQCSHDRCVG